jgi:hypothetical protein
VELKEINPKEKSSINFEGEIKEINDNLNAFDQINGNSFISKGKKFKIFI